MSTDIKILACALSSRDNYDTVSRLVDPKLDLSGLGRSVYELIGKYYTADPEVTACDAQWLRDKIAKAKSHHRESLVQMVDHIERVSVPNALEAVKEAKQEAAAAMLSQALDSNDYTRATALAEEFIRVASVKLGDEVGSKATEVRSGLNAKTLIERRSKAKNNFVIGPKALHRLVPGLMRQQHIGIFALPDAGKTAFAIDASYTLVAQGHKLLYISNEDPLDSLELRFLCRFNAKPKEWVIENQDEATAVATDKGADNLVLVAVPGGSIKEIEGLVVQHRPDVLVVDQIRNLDLPGKEGLVQILEEAGKQMRRMAKQYDLLAVSVTQAADTASGVLALDRNHVDSSKIGFAATLDLLLGIGVNYEYRRTGRRSLSTIGKNKISGLHEFTTVGIDEQTARFYTLGE